MCLWAGLFLSLGSNRGTSPIVYSGPVTESDCSCVCVCVCVCVTVVRPGNRCLRAQDSVINYGHDVCVFGSLTIHATLETVVLLDPGTAHTQLQVPTSFMTEFSPARGLGNLTSGQSFFLPLGVTVLP